MVNENTAHVEQVEKLQELVSSHKQRISPMQHSGLVQKIHQYVIDNIMSGDWPAGAKITEIKVAKELGISHVPVREAMEKLQQEGWVSRIPNRGVFVREFTREEIIELFHIREIIELGALRIIWDRITESQLMELENVVKLQTIAHTSENKEVYRDTDIHFHRLLVHFAGNRTLEKMFEPILMQSNSALIKSDRHNTDIFGSILVDSEGHRKLVEALKEMRLRKAEGLLRKHIQNERNAIMKYGRFK